MRGRRKLRNIQLKRLIGLRTKIKPETSNRPTSHFPEIKPIQKKDDSPTSGATKCE